MDYIADIGIHAINYARDNIRFSHDALPNFAHLQPRGLQKSLPLPAAAIPTPIKTFGWL
jgi:hypothetical protein